MTSQKRGGTPAKANVRLRRHFVCSSRQFLYSCIDTRWLYVLTLNVWSFWLDTGRTMTTSKRKNQHTVRSRGRGTLPVGTNVQESNGVVSVSFDLSEVPPLQRSYSASFAFFTEGDSHETFINFIQQGIESYSSFLRVRLDDLALLNFWRNSKDFYERTGTWYENAYGNKPLDADKPLDLKGVPMVQVSSNLIFASHLESTAIMSFYFFDPRMARKTSTRKNIK